MKVTSSSSAAAIALLMFLFSCGTHPGDQDPITDEYPGAQAEIRALIEAIVTDAQNADVTALKATHLESDKFTKFGPRSFDRQDVNDTNKSEAAFFSSISDYRQESRDLKIDVFGDVAVATYYPHVSFVRDGELVEGNGRQTLVFLKTSDGWKIVHEHGTRRPDGSD